MDAIADIAAKLRKVDAEDLPPAVIDICKKDVLDTVAVAFAGSTAAGIPALVDLNRQWGGRQESSLIACSAKVPAPMAAFVNSCMGHALDFDDTHDEAVLHAGVCTVPPALAIAERQGGISGRLLISAVAGGMELMCRLGVATKLPPPKTGWAYTSVYGAFGATATCAKLLDLTYDQTLNALGIAYSSAAGNMQCIEDGALTKRMQPGFAARAGLEAALLAQAGITGARNILDGKYGLFRVYHKDDYDRSRLLSNLGREYEMANLSFKPYPCCRYTHPYIDAAIALGKAVDLEQITTVTVFVGAAELFLCEPPDVKRSPRTTVDAQFSIPWTVAVALTNGTVRIGDFTSEALRDSRLLSLAQKVAIRVADGAHDRGIAKGTVEVTLMGARKFVESVLHAKGHPRNPMNWDDISSKFSDCANWGQRRLDVKSIAGVIDMVRDLELVDDVGDLARSVA